MASRKQRATVPASTIFPPQVVSASALIAIVFIAYSKSLHGGFALDSNQLLLHDPRIQQVTSENLGRIFHHTYWWPYGESGLYRPFTTLSYLFNYAVLGNGESPAGYHWVNLLLHLCNVLLVYALGLRLLGTQRPAFALAALWAVHPVLTESVSYLAGRPELLAGIGVLGGFLLYLVGTGATGPGQWMALAGVAAATALGVFSKESGVTIVGVIVIYELAFRKERRQARGRVAGLLAVAIPVGAMLYLRMRVLAASPPARFPFVDNPLVKAGFVEGKLTAIAVMARYLWRLVCPVTLSADYSWAQIPLFRGSEWDWASLLVVAGAAAAAILSYRWNRTAFFFAGFAAVTFLPASNLLFPIGTIMAERVLYLPAIGFCACLVLCGALIPADWKRTVPALVCLLVAACAWRTWLRNGDWQDDRHMAEATVRSSPESFKASKTLAFMLYHAGDERGLDEAIAQAEKGLAVLDALPDADNDAEAYRFAGNYYFLKGERSPAEGAQAFRRAAVLLSRSVAIMGWDGEEPNADAGFACRQLALTYLRLGDAPKAVSEALRAVQADPLNAERYLQMAGVLAISGQAGQAAVTLLQGDAVTGDGRIPGALASLFRRRDLDPAGCALNSPAEGWGVNPDCESVKRFLCPAMGNAIGVRMRAGRLDLAERLRGMAVNRFGCGPG
jgi:tetratricopeptide (TPR) repeat protein